MAYDLVLTTGLQLLAVLATPPAILQPHWLVSFWLEAPPYHVWNDFTQQFEGSDHALFFECSSDSVFNGVEPVLMVEQPLSSAPFTKVIREIIIFNPDTAPATIRLSLDPDSAYLFTFTLQPGDTYTLAGTYNSKGRLKMV